MSLSVVCMSSVMVSVATPPTSSRALRRNNDVDPHQKGPAPGTLRDAMRTLKKVPCSPVMPSSSNAPPL